MPERAYPEAETERSIRTELDDRDTHLSDGGRFVYLILGPRDR